MRRFFIDKITLIAFLALSNAISAQNLQSLSGQITDPDSKPVAGASIHILNTQTGGISDVDGKFALDPLPPGKYQLEVTAVGYASVQMEVETGSANAEQLTIRLVESYTQLDAVMVTAEKQEGAVQRIPSSISALSARQIQEYRMWNTRDLTAIVPNLYAANPGDNRNVTSIRGITSTSYDPAIATYVDGVNQFSLDTYIAQLFDVERIEVLRGPQGSLYGRNAMGGVINIITKQPTNTTRGFVEANMGNYGQQRFGFGFRTPLVKNKLFLGVAGVFDQMNGYYTNQFNNSHFDKQHSLTGNYYLKYILNPKWSITLNAKNNQNRNDGAFPLAPGAQDAIVNPFKVNQNAVATMVDNVLNGSLTVAHSGQRFNFSSLSTYQSNYRYYKTPIDGDFLPIDGVTVINNYGKPWNHVNVFTQEFKFTSPADIGSPLKWTAGTYFYYQKSPNKQATRFGKDAALVGAPDSLFSIINTSTAINSGVAFYGQASYMLGNKWDLIAGLRYDYEHKKTSVLGEYQHDPDPNPLFAIRPDTSAVVSYSAISPKATLAYRWSESHQLYGTYSRGFRTGGLTPFSADPSQPPLYPYKPEHSDNFELGVKNSFLENRLKANLSAFYINVNDAQIPTLVQPQLITVIKNAGTLISKGVELELAATVARGWRLEYNGGVTHATYETLQLSQNGAVVDLKGTHQIFTPSATSMLAVQYEVGLGEAKDWRLMARGEWMHVGDQYFDLANTIRQPGYSVLNTRFGITHGRIELTFWGRNLTNKKYIAYAYDFGAAHLGNPKTVGATLRITFW